MMAKTLSPKPIYKRNFQIHFPEMKLIKILLK